MADSERGIFGGLHSQTVSTPLIKGQPGILVLVSRRFASSGARRAAANAAGEGSGFGSEMVEGAKKRQWRWGML